MVAASFWSLLSPAIDMSDGEVARYRNQGGVSGHYLDWYMHFVSSSALVIGLFLASKENSFTTAGVFDISGGRATY